MEFGTVLLALHVGGAGLALILTERERLVQGHPAWLGLLACLVWPLIVAVMLVAIRRAEEPRD